MRIIARYRGWRGQLRRRWLGGDFNTDNSATADGADSYARAGSLDDFNSDNSATANDGGWAEAGYGDSNTGNVAMATNDGTAWAGYGSNGANNNSATADGAGSFARRVPRTPTAAQPIPTMTTTPPTRATGTPTSSPSLAAVVAVAAAARDSPAHNPRLYTRCP